MAIDHGEAKSRVTCQVLHAEVHLMIGAIPNPALSPLTPSETASRRITILSHTVMAFAIYTLLTMYNQ